jgi:hypothetical protein
MRLASKEEERLLKERSHFVESLPSCASCVFRKLFGDDHTTDPYVCARNPDFAFKIGDKASETSTCDKWTGKKSGVPS